MNNNKKVMIVDDHDISLFVTQHLLKQVGYTDNSILLPSGFSAINFIKDNINKEDALPDYIFLDINMPLVDGYEFLQEFEKLKSKISKKIKIFILTGQKNVDERYKNALSNRLIEGILIKPLKISDIKFLA
jgi:CheY-like chemotaxis protein